MSRITDNVSQYVREKGINLSKLSRETDFPYSNLYDSLANPNRKRDLRDDEFLAVCQFLGKDPRDFA